MNLHHRCRVSGKCPPSIIGESRALEEDAFTKSVVAMLDPSGLSLRSDFPVSMDFLSAVKMAGSFDAIAGNIDQRQKVSILEQRRCVLLAIVGSTSSNNDSLVEILERGFLSTVKKWLADILSKTIGGTDLLLHMLTHVSELPVSKSVVMSSGLGKAIGGVEKHKICARTKNEDAIKGRIQKIKGNWNASVKQIRQRGDNSKKESRKRYREQPSEPSKAVKASQDTKKSSFSNLLAKASASASSDGLSAAEAARQKAQQRIAEAQARMAATANRTGDSGNPKPAPQPRKKNFGQESTSKKGSNRVKWADHFGGTLELFREHESTYDRAIHDTSSWADRRRRDRLQEKELLAKAKKSKIMDEDEEMNESGVMQTLPWRPPHILPYIPNQLSQVKSKEYETQVTRTRTMQQARYFSAGDVPSSPAPMNDLEQSSDMASRSSTITETIPFFPPQRMPALPPPPEPVIVQPEPPMPAPSQLRASADINHNLQRQPPSYSQQPMNSTPVQSSGASAETVQAMGLPLFLVGSNVQALQTLAQTPGLLNTFVDSNGLYDHARLTNLVESLSQNLVNERDSQPESHGGAFQPQQQQLQFSYQTQQPKIQNNTSFPTSASNNAALGYRGDQNNAEGNLHVSGYGPSITQADVIALFSQYVQINEVVMKNGFAFVNTNDRVGAKNAKDALNGILMGGSPIRINIAQRRSRDSAQVHKGGSGSASAGVALRNDASSLPRNPYGQIDYDKVRDDRGNPATKNLFVAGYGAGTSEQQLREVFGQHATITGCVMKGTFSFVNTSDMPAAVIAREALSGAVLNGGVLRINFAKETGRLGTSFDSTYGPNTRSPYMRNPVFNN
mmetsp:Transcript_16766/g.23671  ORF Transcript_16766/g.23671 Transcript_16766/m.23671 type:complete len:847 (-) Transcript_16766:382-2922(-)